jgi:hypothetical protein
MCTSFICLAIWNAVKGDQLPELQHLSCIRAATVTAACAYAIYGTTGEGSFSARQTEICVAEVVQQIGTLTPRVCVCVRKHDVHKNGD